MVFAFNASGNNYSNVPGGTSAIAPPNTGISSIAERRLDNFVARANAQLINALKVDGIPLIVWIKSQSGVPCTCCKPSQSSLGIVPSLISDTPSINNYSQQYVEKDIPDVNDNSFKVIRITNYDPLAPATNDPLWAQIINAPTGKSPEANEILARPSIPTATFDDVDDQLVFNNPDANLGETTTGYDPEIDAFFASGDSGALFGGDKTACGICFSTGWTQGYQIVNGKRYTLDASGEIPFSLEGGDLLRNVYPNKFSLPYNTNAWIQWTLELPAFCIAWINVRARDNLEPAYGIVIEYSTSEFGATWAPLTLDVLNSTSNTGASRIWIIRARRDNTLNLQDVKFTHLEMLVITGDNILGQTANFSFDLNFQAFDAIVNTTFDIAPNLLTLPRESVFTDLKYGYLWKITNVTPQMTSKLQVYGYSVTVRLVQQHEMLYRLHTLYVSVPSYLAIASATNTELANYNTTVAQEFSETAPSDVSNYRGLEVNQGGYENINTAEQEGGQQVDNIVLDNTEPLDFDGQTGLLSNTGTAITVNSSNNYGYQQYLLGNYYQGDVHQGDPQQKGLYTNYMPAVDGVIDVNNDPGNIESTQNPVAADKGSGP